MTQDIYLREIIERANGFEGQDNNPADPEQNWDEKA